MIEKLKMDINKIKNEFDLWWEATMDERMYGSRYLARNAWMAAAEKYLQTEADTDAK